MTLNSDDPTSLKGYDMVISISEEAINRQLELLYWTKVRKPLVATDSALSGSPPPSKYLINHDLSIHLKKPDGRINRWEGIEGHIEPPTVSFTNLWGPTAKISEEVRNKMDKKMDFCSVRIFIKFKDDLSLPKGKTEVDDTRGSYFQYVDFEDDPNTGRPIAEPKKISLTGYTMSWVAKLARTDIVDVMKNLIEPAKDESLPDYLPNNIKEEWTKWSKEDNRVFLVSSLWCLFNKDEIVESFELRNADGLLDDKLEGVASIFITAVSRHFSGIKGNENGLPTADNPFVLGYGISQQVPSVTQVVNGQVIYPPPEFLQAKNCHISTTPSPGSPVNGTLNFCMETYRKPPRHVDPISDVKAGKFAINDTLFRASKTNSGDGVLALSQDIFMKHFVQETLAPEMFLDPQSMLSEYLKPWMDKPIAYLNIPKGYLSYVTKKETPNATSYTHRVDFRTCGVQQEGTVAWYGADYIEGFSSVNIVVSSDLMANKEHAVLPADYKRRVFIDVDIRCDFWSKYWIMPKGLLDDAEIFHDVKVPPGWLEAKRHPSFIEAATLYGPKEGFWKKGASFKNIVRDTIDVVTGIPGIGKPAGSKVPEWSQKRSSHVDVAYRVRYILEPSEGGAWLISIDEEATNLPKTEQVSNNEPRAVVEDGDRNGRWGAFVKSEEDDWFWKHLSPGHYLTTFHTYIKDQVSVNGITALANRMGNSFNKMRSTVFLPAGNVFQFFGLDVDESGRMFSHLGYAEGAANGTQTGDPQGPVLVKK